MNSVLRVTVAGWTAGVAWALCPAVPAVGRVQCLRHEVPATGEGGRIEFACCLLQWRRTTTTNVPTMGPRVYGSLPRADPAWRGLFEAGTAAAPSGGLMGRFWD